MHNLHSWDSFASVTLRCLCERFGQPEMRDGQARWELRDQGGAAVRLTLGRRAGVPDGFATLLRPGLPAIEGQIHDAESLRRWLDLVRTC